MTSHPFSFMPDEFKDKRVLVTGGTKGVGAATVRRFLVELLKAAHGAVGRVACITLCGA